MKRALLAMIVLAAGAAAVFAYLAAARDRQYARLIASGDAAAAADQPFVAIEAFSGAIALKPDSMLAYLKRGEIYRVREEWLAALRDLRSAVKLDPTAPRPHERLGDVYYALGRYARAAERYAEYTRLDDRSPRVLYKLGLSRFRTGKVAGAIPPLRQAVSQDDRFAEAYYLLGLCLREQNQREEARLAWERAIHLAPTLTHAREQLADLYGSLGNWRAEIDQLEALVALDPGRPEREMAVALALARAGRSELAVLALGRAIDRYPDQPQLYVALGRLWLEMGEARNDRVALSKALEALQGSVAGGGSTSEGLALLGRALLLIGETEQAEPILQQASTRFPIDPTAFRYLAEAAQRRGHYATARDALLKLQDLAGLPEDAGDRASYAARLADFSLAASDPATAAVWYRRAADARPDDAKLLAGLAEAELRVGNVASAREALRQALERTPDDPSLLALQRRIQ